MLLDFETLYFDAAKKKVIKTTRNKPNIACYDENACSEYTEIFHRKTRNRKEMDPIVSFGETFMFPIERKYFFTLHQILAIAQLKTFKDANDPVESLKNLDDDKYLLNAILYHHSEIPETKVYKIAGENYIIGSPEGAKIVTGPEIPDNALIISTDPPVWMQVGQGRVLFTRGALWLDEPIGEFDTGYITVQKEEHYYMIKMNVPQRKVPLALIEALPYGILRFYPGATPLGAKAVLNDVKYGEEEEAIISDVRLHGPIYYNRKTIFMKNDKVVEKRGNFGDEKELPLDLLVTLEPVKSEKTVCYIPKYYVR